MNKSALFTAYNAAKALGLERRRLNRALGLAQRRRGCSDYVTTADQCSCPDAKYRGIVCKHRIAKALEALAGRDN